jgi:tetratricopeptide (TPR) repeat protein
MLANRRQDARAPLCRRFNMTDWLRLLGMIFYAPLRGMREVRDRGSLAPTALFALLANELFIGYVVWVYLRNIFGIRLLITGFSSLFQSAGTLLFVAAVFVPLAIILTNALEHRAGYRLLFQQEYASVASTCLYAMAAASLTTLLIIVVFHVTGADLALGQKMLTWFQQQVQLQPEAQRISVDPKLQNASGFVAASTVLMFIMAFGSWEILALGLSLRLSAARATLVTIVSGAISVPVSYFLLPLFSTILASPFMLLMLFFLLRGYFTGIVGNQRARAAFKQNLEAATINPRDSSAHYNLGLIHQQRGELDLARERFQRAIDIDPEELDAHYQLGRIARAQGRLPEAIGHFEQVVQRDQSHAQQEIWREIGSTYIAAGQFGDARSVLEKFLDHRPNDPEALYLIGRAHAGLGDSQEAASSMQACIDAVKTAPAYKYRVEKRWLNEAQQFLKGRREAVSSRQ